MTANDILKKFMEYAKYDPDRREFNLLSIEYTLHRVIERIAKIQKFNPTGEYGVLYAKNAFDSIMSEAKIKVLDLLEHPDSLNEEAEMYALLHSQDVKNIKQELLITLDRMSEQLSGTRMIGTPDFDDKLFCDAIDAIAEEWTKLALKPCFFCRAGRIGKIDSFCNKILVFRTMRDCVLTLESAKDALYLCYITENETLNGYFMYMVKNGGNLFCPVSDHYWEKYPGETSNHRNNRWTEGKGYHVFPYDSIVRFSGEDYKGYYTKSTLTEEAKNGFPFADLSAQERLPVFASMMLLASGYSDTDPEGLQVYSTYILQGDKALPARQEAAIVPTENSIVAKNHNALQVIPSDEEVLTGAWHSKFKKVSSFSDPENIFVTLYGDGFRFDPTPIFGYESKRLTDGSAVKPYPEMIGTKEEMELAMYWLARKQLAMYCQDKIFEELEAFGGKQAVLEWYADTMESRLDRLEELCFEKYYRVQNGEENFIPRAYTYRTDPTQYFTIVDAKIPLDCIGFAEGKDYSKNYELHPSIRFTRKNGKLFGGYLGAEYDRRTCMPYHEGGAACNLFFRIQPDTWENIEQLTGTEVPKVLKGWRRSGHGGSGNDILDACDKCERICTPFENSHDGKHTYDRENFAVVIPFAKSEFKRKYKEWLKTYHTAES